MIWTGYWPKDPTYAIFLKSWGFKDVKYDIPCVNTIQLGPSPFNSAPQCKTSSLRHHFRQNSWKLGFWWNIKFTFYQSLPLPGAYLGKNGPLWPTSNTQKITKNGPIWAKNGKKRTAENNCTLFSSIFQNFAPFPRYGRLKSKFLCERYSHCIYSSCSIELTKTGNTWSLTAVSEDP